MFFAALLSLLLLFPSNERQHKFWGKTGHRIVGNIAADHLNSKAQKAVRQILGTTSMAIASTWMDRIKSDSAYDYTHDWHWVTIPSGMTYSETEKNPNGDLIKTLRKIIKELEKGNISANEEREKVKMLIHLVGDIHQPLHVGTGKDRGGNNTDVAWFHEPSNLHRVWDSKMIDDTKLSYTEFSHAINHPTDKQITRWQDSEILDWAYESMDLREQVYNIPDSHQIGYEYKYKNRDLLHRRLLQAGIRLAGVLNDIYG